MLKLLLAVVVLLIGGTSAINVQSCKNGAPLPLYVDVVGCEKTPCNMVKGTTATINIAFVGDNSKSLYAQTLIAMHGGSILVPLNENVANVCDNLFLGKTCPIAQNEMAVYVMKLDIEPYFPEISPSMQISLNPDRYYPGLNKLFNNLIDVVEPQTSTFLDGTISMGQLLGDLYTKNFFTYKGSLTTPGCSEAVLWHVFPDPLPIAQEHIYKFWDLLDSTGAPLINNYRPVQGVNGRKIYYRVGFKTL
uniref:Uncharacterized protein n=1 Tax=Musca domestica TaxID=7370 RepID=A0A1I8NFC8_MUSDO